MATAGPIRMGGLLGVSEGRLALLDQPTERFSVHAVVPSPSVPSPEPPAAGHGVVVPGGDTGVLGADSNELVDRETSHHVLLLS